MNITVSITIKNNLDEVVPVIIPAGQIIECAQTEYGVQNVAVEKEYKFKLLPYEERTVAVVGLCLNLRRSAPSSTPGRATPFKYGGSKDQDAIWDTVATPIA